MLWADTPSIRDILLILESTLKEISYLEVNYSSLNTPGFILQEDFDYHINKHNYSCLDTSQHNLVKISYTMELLYSSHLGEKVS